MKEIIWGLMVGLVCAGYANGSGVRKTHFEWFNLSTNHIWVTEVVGFSLDISPGRLEPSNAEEQLESSELVFSETVRIEDRITIKWIDNGKAGWPGGLKSPGSTPPGVAHQLELKRNDLGIPSKLRRGKIRYTYLGNDKWRVKVVER